MLSEIRIFFPKLKCKVQHPAADRVQDAGNYANVNAPVTLLRVAPGDVESLKEALQQLGLSQGEAETAALAIQEDNDPATALQRLRKSGGRIVAKLGEAAIVQVIKSFFAAAAV